MQKEKLRQYLARSPVLQALYFAKQQLNGFLVMMRLKEMFSRRAYGFRNFENYRMRVLA
ncbi:transposase [Kerstersia gyiorum]|nr:transposase [Kerstersia gyiorum]MCP1671628.1 transposase [Kerstersia gyiorum]MCP1679478.1 transposase [Kerstersia gyiorum]MCP1709727.1 transposase [Kerstersia gyiorum]MCP1713236.1 transposase [Kerstersia gyiorum]